MNAGGEDLGSSPPALNIFDKAGNAAVTAELSKDAGSLFFVLAMKECHVRWE
jgi:hypothetical protein